MNAGQIVGRHDSSGEAPELENTMWLQNEPETAAIRVHGPSPEAEEVVEQMLQNAGCPVIPNGQSLIAIVWHLDETTLMRRVRSIRTWPTVRIVVGIPSDFCGTRSRLGVYGVRHFFDIPINPEELLNVVQEVMLDVPCVADRNS